MQLTRIEPSVRVRLFERTMIFVATGCYAGYSTVVPGTVGSLLGMLFYVPLTTRPNITRLFATAALFFLGVFASNYMESIWRIKDPKPVVIDEIAGMWIGLLFVPYQLRYFVAAFVSARQAEWLLGG